MIFPDRTSFTPLSTITLPSSHILHPGSCNPSMDLVVLLSPPPSSISNLAANSWKGKGKDIGSKTQVSLWRTGGSKVWEVAVNGKVAGLAWSEDGLILSLLSTSSSVNTIEHLSVHTGEVIRSIPISSDIKMGTTDNVEAGQWINMKWASSSTGWPEIKNGSAIGIIDSLPRVTPVDPPKPLNALPFMRQNTAPPPKPTLHSSLTTFPCLLPSAIPLQPDILSISNHQFLTGTFPFPDNQKQGNALLELSRISDKMVGFLDVILRSLENAEIAFREGEKQTLICREDLETCAQQQAMSTPDVHADLFRFLMTGRSGIAVNEWLGNRLTGRTITKWDQTLDTSFRTIQNLIIESVSPALERLILLLEEMRGWSRTPKYQTKLHIHKKDITKAIDLVLGFAKLVDQMRRDAEHEMKAAAEFMKWLKYEIARAASQDPSSDDLPTPTHDLKLVWSFMINGFVHSTFHNHFPYLLVRPPKDYLPDDFETYSRKPIRSLEEVLKETTSELKLDGKQIFTTPSIMANESLDSTGSESLSMDMSISMIHRNDHEDADGDLTPTGILSDDDDDDEDLRSRISSPDTVEKKDYTSTEEEVKRVIQKEPWVWANTLIRDLENLVKGAIGDIGTQDQHTSSGTLRDSRAIVNGIWECQIHQQDPQQVWLTYTINSVTSISAFILSDPDQNSTCLSIQFFDDEEIVLLLEFENGRYMVTLRYIDLLEGMFELPQEKLWTMQDIINTYGNAFETIPPMPITRSRYLGPTPMIEESDKKGKVEIALNGRKGRRLGCVLFEDGKEVQVWDLDIDEDEDEDEEGEEDGGMED
ncbi:uncharacterized protein L201_006737 [Kwoniella dendrophila CBS 6074]|uniref:Anaphase-promoting complex subunit 4 n=1 Tax=Kwoniella dendrophila CBS 6074 TaxID=1295534 RepID=A0AAX4K4V6_9TREE